MRRLLLLALAAPALLGAPAQAHATARSCHPIVTVQTSEITPQGTTTGKILTGFLKGSTQAQFTSATPRADGGLDYTSVLTITTATGTLTLTDSGSSNPNGTFTEHGTVASGTGALAGATGRLAFVGATRDQVHFTAALVGVVCV